MNEEVRTTVRLPADLHARWAAHAQRERRSLNADLIYLLEGILGSPRTDPDRPGSESSG
ncbi:antitoxin [Streptomyces roseoverticillatus]|uniref:antitoxin n=1 Tax=Streptomyces roseoverticillatus TaxID=66429 RepID=UPI000D142027|nr:antitoxin [Streptomyces roseoverticillatus]